MGASLPVTARSRVRRLPERGSNDWDLVAQILDEALVCHVGFVLDGAPVVIPTAHAREGTTLYLHGAPASRMLRTVAGGVEVCVTATLLDGLVLARSLFHHSLNYRSAVCFGRATEVVDLAEKERALRLFAEHVLPGRTAEVRAPSVGELKATRVLAVRVEEASAKVRSGPPKDDEADMHGGTWAGVLPVRLELGTTVADTPDLPPPASALAAEVQGRFASAHVAADPGGNSTS
jgi:nitroimidazol reductase NimA-like FMN-containing flavoprotein (pyridoxamine 5'-phosphate oxidase superfamily)